MLNENSKYERVESKRLPLLKNDIYQVELYDVVEKENQKYQSEEIEKVLTFEFAVLSGKDVEGGEGRLRLLDKNFVPTYLYIGNKGKNNLYKIIEALIGRELTDEEETNGISGKTINFLIGKQCRVLLEKKASKKDASVFYSNIVNFLVADNQLTGLTEKERADIKEIKSKVNKEDEKTVKQEVDDEEIKVENIPF